MIAQLHDRLIGPTDRMIITGSNAAAAAAAASFAAAAATAEFPTDRVHLFSLITDSLFTRLTDQPTDKPV